MARIRTIKPEFWTNDKILSIAPLTRLLFIGMWNFADDYGRMDFAPLSIKARVFPNDEILAADVRDMLNELCHANLLLIYSANDKEYIQITGWDHQKIDKRNVSKIPAPFDDISIVSPTPADLPRSSPNPAHGREGKGEEGKGREGKQDTREVALSDDWPSDFENRFWVNFPNKVGKPAALKALKAARRRRASFEGILSGLDFYIRSKPPDRPWLNPATFLNQNRWEDQPAQVQNGNSQAKPGSLIAAIDRQLAALEREESSDFALPENSILRVSG